MNTCPKCGYKKPGTKEEKHLWETYMCLVLEKARQKLKKEIGFGVPENKEKRCQVKRKM